MAIDRSTELYIGCECHSTEHIMRVTYYDWVEDEYPELYFEPQVHTHHGFFGRLKRAFNYLFFGTRLEWTDIIPKKDDLTKLQDVISRYLERAELYEANESVQRMKRKEEKESNEG